LSRPIRLLTFLFLVVAGWILFVHPCCALDIPAYSSPVTDLAGVLTGGERQQLSADILDYRRKAGVEIGVLIIPTLDGMPLEDYAHDVFSEWGVGRASDDDGVLFLVAWEDRKTRLEVGYGLEGALTDLEAGRIVNKRSPMATHFRNGEVSAGVQSVIDGIKEAVAGDYRPPEGEHNSSSGLSHTAIFFLIMAFIFFMRIARAARMRRKSGWTKGSFDDFWGGLGGMGGLGSGSGGSSSGGGFSFGGGSSGGGGASGGW
jgi:uncharacterized protein